jgi:hypothetical protein
MPLPNVPAEAAPKITIVPSSSRLITEGIFLGDILAYRSRSPPPISFHLSSSSNGVIRVPTFTMMQRSLFRPCGGRNALWRAPTPHRLVPRIEASRAPGQEVTKLASFVYYGVRIRILSHIMQTPRIGHCRENGFVLRADAGVHLLSEAATKKERWRLSATLVIFRCAMQSGGRRSAAAEWQPLHGPSPSTQLSIFQPRPLKRPLPRHRPLNTHSSC